MTDINRATSVLLACLDATQPDTIVSVDTYRDELDAAALTSAEKSGALKAACNDGYIHAITLLLDDGMTMGTVQIRSRHEAGKGRWLMAYRRTDKAVGDS